MGDDALGPYVVRTMLARYDFSSRVSVLDVGTPGLDFTPYIADARAVVVIDTVKSDAKAGTLRFYRDREIIGGPPLPRSSPHEPGLREALMATELTDSSPDELLLIGVVPQNVESGTGLSKEISAAVPKVIEQVLTELERLGVPATPREVPGLPDIWWEGGIDGN